MHCLAKTHQNSVEYEHTTLPRLPALAIWEEPKVILKLPYLTRKRVLSKSQRALSNRKNLQKALKSALSGRANPKIV